MATALTISVMLLSSLCVDVAAAAGRRDGVSGGSTASRSEGRAARCSYTFIVPQQKLKGALCLSTATAAAHNNRSEAAALWAEVRRQQEQLDKLQAQLEQQGALAGEVRALRKESSGMNGRIAQLYAQLLQELLSRKEQAGEQRRLESLLLNATTQALQVSTNFRELERKYAALTSSWSSQNQLIARLEKQCQCRSSAPARDVAPPPAVVTELPKNPSNLQPNHSSDTPLSRQLQRDQSPAPSPPPTPPPPLQEKAFHVLPTAGASSPTEQALISFPVTKSPGPWRDCQHVLESGETTSGIYLLRPQSSNQLLQAWCEQEQQLGGWTLIQRRQDGSVNFFRTWEQYKQGFGNLDGEYWLGLEPVHQLTQQTRYRLRVQLEDWSGRRVFAEYDGFQVEAESDGYRLRLGGYHGTAGDSLSWHNNKAFTTLDRDKDGYTGNCAHYQKGGWWYHMCAHSNLNGVWYRGGHYRSRYQDGVYWAEFHGGSYSLRRVAMMIRPI